MRPRPYVLVLALTLASCATYTEDMASAHRAFYTGELDEAHDLLEEQLEDDEDDAALLRLEQAVVLNARGDYERSARLLIRTDDRMEVLDYTSTPVDELADFLFSLGATEYKASPTEKLFINTLNMINFLALRDYEEAAVEARRARILLTQEEVTILDRYDGSLAWALAGLSFEMARRHGEAGDAYREVSAGHLKPSEPENMGTLLVVVQNGKVPVRVEGVFYLFIDGFPRRFQVPVLVSRPGRAAAARVSVGGEREYPVPAVLDLEREMRDEFEEQFPRLMAAAIVQALPRATAAEAIRRTLRDDGDSAGQMLLAEALAFAVETIWAEMLPVDTRSWSLLPAEVRMTRIAVPPGEHEVVVTLSGGVSRRVVQNIVVEPGELSVVSVVGAMGSGYTELVIPEDEDLTGTARGIRALRMAEQALLWNQVTGSSIGGASSLRWGQSSVDERARNRRRGGR